MAEPGQGDGSILNKHLDTYRAVMKPALVVIGFTIMVLTIIGAASSEQPMTVQGLFLAILFFSCLAALIVVLFQVFKNMGRSKYQINDKPGKKTGQVNGAFDEEKGGEGGVEAWQNNYVPYEKYPNGIPAPTFTTEKGEKMEKMEEERKEIEEEEKEVNVEKEDGVSEIVKDNDKWKNNYVPYEDEIEEDKQDKNTKDEGNEKENKIEEEEEKDVKEKN